MRKSIQLPPHAAPLVTVTSRKHARKLKLGEGESSSMNLAKNNSNTNFDEDKALGSENGCSTNRRLTRSALNKTLLERDSESSAQDKVSSPAKNHPQSSSSKLATTGPHHSPNRVSVFDIRGLSRLKATFSALDNSVKDVVMGREKGKNEDGINILAPDVVSTDSCWIECLLPSISSLILQTFCHFLAWKSL